MSAIQEISKKYNRNRIQENSVIVEVIKSSSTRKIYFDVNHIYWWNQSQTFTHYMIYIIICYRRFSEATEDATSNTDEISNVDFGNKTVVNKIVLWAELFELFIILQVKEHERKCLDSHKNLLLKKYWSTSKNVINDKWIICGISNMSNE